MGINRKLPAGLIAILFIVSIIPEILPLSDSAIPSDSVEVYPGDSVFYSRNASVGYAYRWYNGRNPHYNDFTSSGGDCANFVSQCLIAGGLSLHNGTDGSGYGVYPDADRPTTYSNGTIPYCDYLHQHLVNYQPVDYAYVTTANATIPSWIEVGDVIIFGNSTDYWQHAMLVVWKGTDDLGLAAHTTDTWNASFWTELNYFGLANFYHIRDSGYTGEEFLFEVRASTLNVRVGPGISGTGSLYQDIGDIHAGEMYIAIRKTYDASGNLWYHFWFDDRAAWCAANYSGNVYASPISRERYLEIDVSRYLNVRTGPGISYTDIGEVYPGTRFYPIQTFNSSGTVWVKYHWGGQEVWSSGKYMEVFNYIDVHPKKNMARVFMGFYPYWLGTDDSFMEWDYISHLAWFDISLNSNGTVSSSNNWPSGWTGLVSDAHANNTKVLVTFTLFGSTSIDTLLSTASYRATAIDNIVSAVVSGNADGAVIDFETPSSGDGANLSIFMRELKENLTSRDPSYELAICLSPYPWSSQVWGDAGLFPDLNTYVDYYFLMGYDYHWSGSSTTGPCGALFWSSNIDAYHAILKYLGYGALRSKFIYGVPYYGYDWPVSGTEYDVPGASTTGTGSSRTYDSAMSKLSSTGASLNWNESSKSPWFWYYDSINSIYRQVWFDNETSIKYKYELINRFDLAGAGTWALGYDSSTTEIWKAIGEKTGNFSLDIVYPSPDSIIGGTVNATVLAYGGISELWYRVPGKDWQKATPDIHLHRETIYVGGKAYRGYQSVFHLIWNTNALLPGNYTLEIRANNSFQIEYMNYSYVVKRNIALEGSAWGSSDAYNLIDDEDYIDYYSGFASNDVGSALYIGLPCNYSIQAFKFRLWDGDSRYYQYRIDVSRDNSTWTEVVNRTSSEWKSWQWIGFAEGNLTARYIRITGTYNSANQWYHITEFKIFAYNDTMLHGKVVVNGEPLRSSSLRIMDENNSVSMSLTSDEYGKYEVDISSLNLSEGDFVNLSITQSGYMGWNGTYGSRYVSQIRLDINCMNVRFQVGWNLISLPWQNASAGISDALSGISWDRAMIYLNGRWHTYNTARVAKYNLGFLDANNTMGIWVHATSAGILSGPSTNVGPTNITLHKGWNLVGYPSNTVRTVSDALSGIPYDYVQVYNATTETITTLAATDTMEPGNGYWIHVTADVVWSVKW